MKTMISTKQILLLVLLILIGTSNGYASYQERAYLQTDKRFYISGELLWLKLYTTNIEGKLSSFSKVGYVELKSRKTKSDHREKRKASFASKTKSASKIPIVILV